MIENCTAGEWEVYTAGGTPFYIATPGKLRSSHTVIARLIEGSEDEKRANAALMAASKDLYSELIGANETICDLCKKVNPQHKDCTSCQDREARLKAIHKAAGKE